MNTEEEFNVGFSVEENEEMISVRKHGGEDLGMISVAEFSKLIETEISKTLNEFKV